MIASNGSDICDRLRCGDLFSAEEAATTIDSLRSDIGRLTTMIDSLKGENERLQIRGKVSSLVSDWIVDAAAASGLLLVVAGVWWIYPPAALIVGGGVMCIGASLAAVKERGKNGSSR